MIPILILVLLAPFRMAWSEGEYNMDLIDDTKVDEHRLVSPDKAAEAKKIGELLDAMYVDCGRYPTTKEGLMALASKPKTYNCKKWGIETGNGRRPYLSSVPKGWSYNSKNDGSYILEPLK